MTGNVYAFGVANDLVALSFDGKPLWTRSLTDEFGSWTTHGGRTVSPIIEGDLVIVSTVTDGFADLNARRHRYYAVGVSGTRDSDANRRCHAVQPAVEPGGARDRRDRQHNQFAARLRRSGQ